NWRYSIFSTLIVSLGRPFLNENLTFWQPVGLIRGVAGLTTDFAWTFDLSFGSAIVSAPRMIVAAIAIVILLIALLLIESLSAGEIESLSPQRPKISPSRAFGCIGLLNAVAERGCLARFFNPYWRAARKHVAVFFCFRSCDSLGQARARCFRPLLQPLSAYYLGSLDIGMRVTRGDWDCVSLNGGGNHSRSVYWEQLLEPRARNTDRRGSCGGVPVDVQFYRLVRPVLGDDVESDPGTADPVTKRQVSTVQLTLTWVGRGNGPVNVGLPTLIVTLHCLFCADGADDSSAGLAQASDPRFVGVIVIAQRMSAIAKGNAILFIASLLL